MASKYEWNVLGKSDGVTLQDPPQRPESTRYSGEQQEF